MSGCVYVIKNTINEKEYIGSTKNIEKRMASHFQLLKNNRHHCRHLQFAYNKYGRENFIYYKIYEGDDYIEHEYKLINENFDELYNMSRVAGGGDIISYHPDIEDIKNRISNTLKKRYEENPNLRKIHSRCGEENYNWRGGTSISYCECGNTKAIPAATCSACRDRTGENNPFYGKKHTSETKLKLSIASAGRMPVNSNKVEIDGIVYMSQSKAAKALNLSDGTICNRCNSSKFPNYKRI